MSVSSGVFPVFENKFKINTKGRTGGDENFVTIAEMETFSVEMDGKCRNGHPWMQKVG